MKLQLISTESFMALSKLIVRYVCVSLPFAFVLENYMDYTGVLISP